MKYIDEFRNGTIAAGISKKIASLVEGHDRITIMEVCGSHTMSIYRYGLKNLLPPNLRLLSGPGCPVCVTSTSYIDTAIAMVQKTDSCLVSEKEVIITTFGDMMKVPGSSSSLEKERAKGASVAVVYSTLDALRLAEKHPDKQIVFLAIGFETTAPTIAASVIEAERRGLKNYFLLTAHKVMPPVMKALLKDKELNLDGFLCPAHVSAIIGSRSYEFIARDFHISCVIAGFEPLDILQGIYMLLEQIVRKDASVRIQYSRVAREEGNPTALFLLDRVFEPCDDEWRGLGLIPKSGLKLRNRYAWFDALTVFRISDFGFRINSEIRNPKSAFNGCICGDILRGIKIPSECKLFKKVCNPEHPVGACMVSNEGTCAAWYKYGET
ncbi:MAG: hydrogenase formation protein HypD [Candidatus Brocadia sinica]|uniref:Hydrogenase maturation protein n=1 Tax=Candidatus Brocadia sinica JPN1 TaxID=1197129 RepID=A0ABQ0JS69_9BACT|nr:hydrogenase formation protein HypD [Candidatus Brocadia sinica]MBL1168421.1 hydrogenase formation protein HypD [Candidatus Brocadia sp. AMX1]NOG43171.1 hydrogenase formation protein HypD [Planctomycetota bacterium]RIJ90557.1 MAG: hydrogenase formation protein HypD [Candidatus Brocadia sp.]MCK6468393.1 hydrogenase formation protein HypD [Candidatus Brocadia sinica]GAN31572.1 hydrogenase maturation protein [Candidatus Brocadia sinica JPN1]